VLKALYRLISSTVYYYSNTTCRGYFYKFVLLGLLATNMLVTFAGFTEFSQNLLV